MSYLCTLLSADNTVDLLKADKIVDHEGFFAVLFKFFLSGCSVRPCLLIIENIQWLDATSQDFITQMVDSIGGFPVMLLFTYRSGYTHGWGDKSYYIQIPIPRLTDIASQQMIQTILGSEEIPGPLLQIILERSEGNPLFIEEALHSLLERGDVTVTPEGQVLVKEIEEIEIPHNLQEAIQARIDQLDPESKRTIQVASVIGRAFTAKLLKLKLEMEEHLEQYLRDLSKLELIQEKTLFPDLGYVFRQAVTKDVVYGSLLSSQRQEIHAAIAQLIETHYKEQLEDYYSLLAHHYSQANEKDKAIYYMILAGTRAQRLYATREAIQHFDRALKLMAQSHSTQQGDELLARRGLGDSYDLLGEYSAALTHYEGALALTVSAEEEADLYRRMGVINEKKGELKTALSLYEKALNLLDKESDSLEKGKTLMNAGWVYNRLTQYEQASSLCHKALEIFLKTHSLHEVAQAHNNLAVIFEFMGEWNRAEEHNKKCIEIMEALGDQRKLGAFYAGIGILCWKRRKLTLFKRHHKMSLEKMEEIENPHGIANALANLARVYIDEGDIVQARDALVKSTDIFEKIGVQSKLCQNALLLTDILIREGNFQEATTTCKGSLELSDQLGFLLDQALAHHRLALIEINKQGDPNQHFEESLNILQELNRPYERALVLKSLGEWEVTKEDSARGSAHLEEAMNILSSLGVSFS